MCVRERDREEKERERKQRLSVTDFDVVTKKYRATQANASTDHTYTHMITHTHTRSHIHTSPSCSLVNGCCRQKTDLANVERVSQVGFEVPYKVINTAQHTAEVIQHTPHHESRRKQHFGEQCNSRGSNDHTCGAQGVSRDVGHPETRPTQTYSVSGEPEIKSTLC